MKTPDNIHFTSGTGARVGKPFGKTFFPVIEVFFPKLLVVFFLYSFVSATVSIFVYILLEFAFAGTIRYDYENEKAEANDFEYNVFVFSVSLSEALFPSRIFDGIFAAAIRNINKCLF